MTDVNALPVTDVTALKVTDDNVTAAPVTDVTALPMADVILSRAQPEIPEIDQTYWEYLIVM